MTTKQYVQLGLLGSNIPPIAAMIAVYVYAKLTDNWDYVVPVFLLAMVLGWLWWSFFVPRWRLYVYKRITTDQIPELKELAIKSFLTWPDDSIFAKTEIKSSAHKRMEEDFEKGIKTDTATNPSPALDWRVYAGIIIIVFMLNLLR